MHAGVWLAAWLAQAVTPDAGAESASAPVVSTTRDPRWSGVHTTTLAPPQAIGAYAAGCLAGAQALSARGTGYRLTHPERRRFFGHPSLVAFVRRLAQTAAKAGFPALLVGDLGQMRGGPTPSGHRSHQTGLDVDIGYTGTLGARSGAQPVAVADLKTTTLTKAWQRRIGQLLLLAAADPEVDRIFVNPAVKRALCADLHARKSPAVLAKLRPWWAHHDHFHVRLRCPADSAACEPQQPLGAEAGCDPSLDWWWSEDARATRERRASPEDPANAGVPLPPACTEVLNAPDAPAKAPPK